MNRQNLFDYLDEKEWVEDRITDAEERKKLLNRLTAIYEEHTKGSPKTNDQVAERLAELLDETDNYVSILNDIKYDLIEIVKILGKMKNKTYRKILYKRYIRGLKLEEIAISMKKDYKYICNLHGYALNEFDKLCENF